MDEKLKEAYRKKRDEQWRKDLRGKMKPKERMAIERVKMPEADCKKRANCFEEVNTGLSKEMALQEAQRCLDCANPTCIDGCPVSIDIPGFIKHVEANDMEGALKTLKTDNTLPAICGRVCPQESQCEANCFYQLKLNKEPVAIGFLERFVADFERTGKQYSETVTPKSKKEKIAIIGSGPAGLAAAGDLVKMGYQVTVFEALHEFGGVLKYGIPEFRLPKDIVDYEIDNLKKLGIEFKKNTIIGKTLTFDELAEQGYKAYFIGSGAGLPNFMNIPGENLNGVLSSNEYLTRVNLMGAGKPGHDTPVIRGKKVAVIGGGNTAMDAVRTAKRMGAERAMILYRRSFEQMPARKEEIQHAVEEGIEFLNLNSPVEYIGENGWVEKIKVQKMELGEPDKSGRRRPVPVKESEYYIEADMVVVSIGVSPNPLILNALSQLNITKWKTISINENNMETNIPGFYAGGDIVRGGATVILAMGDGRKAAKNIDHFLQSCKKTQKKNPY
jgi:glutamate synthase (NADPH) small chain